MVENLYQGFLTTQKDALLDDLAHVLYPGCSASLTPEERISIFYWVASLKDMFARRFSDFFQPASANAENLLGSSPNIGKQLQESMDAQIRALTKGDITKEKEILSLDTWRALTELNAQAKEYKQINAQINAKNDWSATDFFQNLVANNKLAVAEGFTFCKVSGLEGFEEALHAIQQATAFCCVSDIADGYTELNNTPRTRRIKPCFSLCVTP